MTYFFEEPNKLTLQDIERLKCMMPPERQERVECLRFDRDKQLSAAAYAVLLYALRERGCEVREPLRWDYNEYGKPRLRDFPELHFNLSHCDGAAACALSDFEVGVDIQDITPPDSGVVRMTMSDGECGLIAGSAAPERTFTRLWTVKESYLKLLGSGLDSSLRKLDFADCVSDCFTAHGCCFRTKATDGWYLTRCAATNGSVAGMFVRLTIDDIRSVLI